MIFPQIQEVNNITDADKILVGQRLWIPLPCSCDNVGGEAVVHYGHLVPAGSTVGGIAEQFNTTESTLLNLNGMASSSQLQADSIIDVPLKGNNAIFFSYLLDWIHSSILSLLFIMNMNFVKKNLGIHYEYEFCQQKFGYSLLGWLNLVLIDAYLLLIFVIN